MNHQPFLTLLAKSELILIIAWELMNSKDKFYIKFIFNILKPQPHSR